MQNEMSRRQRLLHVSDPDGDVVGIVVGKLCGAGVAISRHLHQ
jgi:hypothetical protein